MDPEETSQLYSAGPLEIQIEDATGSKGLTYYVQWLDNEATTREESTSNTVFDAECLEGEVALHEQNTLSVIAKRHNVENQLDR